MMHARLDYNRIQDPANLIPVDMPVFLLLGKDKHAAATVRFWADRVESDGGDPEMVRIARAHAEHMDALPCHKQPDLPAGKDGVLTSPVVAPSVSETARSKPLSAEQQIKMLDKIQVFALMGRLGGTDPGKTNAVGGGIAALATVALLLWGKVTSVLLGVAIGGAAFSVGMVLGWKLTKHKSWAEYWAARVRQLVGRYTPHDKAAHARLVVLIQDHCDFDDVDDWACLEMSDIRPPEGTKPRAMFRAHNFARSLRSPELRSATTWLR